jgi:hypothetical protein
MRRRTKRADPFEAGDNTPVSEESNMDCKSHRAALKALAAVIGSRAASVCFERASPVSTRTIRNCGNFFAQETASCRLSKKRSTTTAARWETERPHNRAAFRLTTSGPLSTATHSASGKTTLLPNGIRLGSTAQCPARRRAPFQQARWPEPSLCQYTVMRASSDWSPAKACPDKATREIIKTAKHFITFGPTVSASRSTERRAASGWKGFGETLPI